MAVHSIIGDWKLWLGFLLVAIPVCLSPGAGAIQSMSSGLTHGLVRSYWSIAGQELGLIAQLTVVAVGLGAVVAGSAAAFAIIKVIGVVYLLYLAVRQWRSAGTDVRDTVGRPTARAGIPLLARGFLVNATNPKALVFYLAVLPQFLQPKSPLLPQYVAIGATFVLVDIVVMSMYAGLAARLLSAPGARQQRILNRSFSGLFATAAVLVALVRRGAA